MAIKSLKRNYADAGILLIRVSFSIMILFHGIGKFEDLVSGRNDFADPLGIGSIPSLILVTFAEFVCPLFLIPGLFTRFTLLPLIISMVIIVFIHKADVELLDKESPVLYLIAFSGLLLSGPGKYSVDNMLLNKA